MVTVAWRVELDFGAGFVDVSADLRTQEDLVCRYGIDGDDPSQDRIASTGECDFGLDNSSRNSGGVAGYYSPLHSAARSGFAFDMPMRLALSSPSVASGITYYKFRGHLSDILPAPGTHEDRLTRCKAVDIWDDYARINEPDIAAAQDQRSDTLISALLDASDIQPAARVLDTGTQVFAWSMDGGTGQRLKMRERLQQVALSECGRLYTIGDATQGGTLRFEHAHARINATSQVTLDNTMVRADGVSVPSSRADIYGSIQITVHPTREDVAADTVIYSLETTATLVRPGDTITIVGDYLDPESHDAIGATEQADLVASTDYVMNSEEDGSGSDLTDAFSVGATFTGASANISITNDGVVPGYVTVLQVRGKGIYRRDATVEHTVSDVGDRVLDMDMPLQNDTNFAEAAAEYFAYITSGAFPHVPQVTFHANRSVELMTAALQREPGDRITVRETQTGLDADFTINSVQLTLKDNHALFCSWGLEPADTRMYWALGDTGYSELGQATVLGF